jgi:hypothetical protein
MTEYELLDLVTSTSIAAAEAFGYYLTILASYLVAAYLAGKQLTTTQAMTISVLFVFGALATIYSMFNYMSRAIDVADSLEMLHPERFYGAQPFARNLFVGIQTLGVFACLKFMWDIRHAKTE